MDLLEGLLMVDNIVRLGIDRHFEKEIKEILDCVYRYHKTFNLTNLPFLSFSENPST